MNHLQSNKNKKLAIVGILVVLGIVIGLASFYIYTNVSGSKPTAAPEATEIHDDKLIAESLKESSDDHREVVKTFPVPDDLKKLKYNFVTPNTVLSLFEAENIIPIRLAKTEYIGAKKAGIIKRFFRRIGRLFSRRKSTVTPLKELTKRDMAIMVENSRIIKQQYESQVIKKTNENKSAEKQVLIEEIREIVYSLMTELPEETSATMSEHLGKLFWSTYFIVGYNFVDWVEHNCTLEELQAYKTALENILFANASPVSPQTNLYEVMSHLAVNLSNQLKLGVFRQKRIELCNMLAAYKATQPVIAQEEAAYTTEKLLYMLDLLSHFIYTVPEARIRIDYTLENLECTIKNIFNCPEQKMLAEYNFLLQEHNDNLIECINGYLRFIADLEQYVAVNIYKTEHQGDLKQLRNIKAANTSSYILDLSPKMSDNEIIEKVSAAITKYVHLLAGYRYLLSITEVDGEHKYDVPMPAVLIVQKPLEETEQPILVEVKEVSEY
ncbi:hypothetical protein NEOKW01_1775 [Nematocida sp. AWRm80]|nr:hypothetical protein NEOKW01_1775 [Nematocida sp. AWRm80]